MNNAHLIKLAEYISRYQSDLQRYTSQYTRMKKERWYYLKSNWEQLEREGQEETGALKQRQEESILMKKLLRIKEWGKGNRRNHMPSEAADLVSNSLPLSLEQVRVEFLDELFQAQLRWASTSLVEESRLHPQYRHDEWLRFFSQQIPDNYLLMYKPVFLLAAGSSRFRHYFN